MKINNTTNKRKKITIIAGVAMILAIAVGGVYAYQYFQNGNADPDSNSVNLNPPTEDEKNAGDTVKQNTVDTDKGNTSGSDPTEEPATDGDKKTASAEITAANQSDGTLQIRTLIHIVTGTGKCTLLMNGPNSKTYTQSVNIQALPSSSTCAGFDVPVSDLSTGSWKIEVSFTNDEYSAVTSKEVVVK